VPTRLAFISPCSPVPTKVPPAGDAWLHEPKLDGYRLQIVKDSRHARLYSRRGPDWTERLETIAAALQGLACRSAIIDAEIVLRDSSGRPDFRGLHRSWRSAAHSSLCSLSISCTEMARICAHYRSWNAGDD
jgi:bifunctional non-homologous end joining protein LigD